MKSKYLFAPVLLAAFSLFIFSCGGKDKKKDDGKTSTETVGPSTGSDDGMVPKIDTTNLKDEASILAAMQTYVDAQVASDKKQKEDPSYSGHFVELTNLHSALLRISTAFAKTFSDPAKAVEFSEKVSAIQDKMYAK